MPSGSETMLTPTVVFSSVVRGSIRNTENCKARISTPISATVGDAQCSLFFFFSLLGKLKIGNQQNVQK